MIKVNVKTPFKKDLTLVWKGREVETSGDKEVLQYWGFLQSQGLYGKYGHILDIEDCYLSDVVSALTAKVGWQNLKFNVEAKVQLAKEEGIEEGSPIPEGAMT